jgi:hypothetical protein
MKVMRSEDIEEHRQAIVEFGQHLQELLANMEPVAADSFLTRFPKWVPKAGSEMRVAELSGQLSSLTGPAAAAVEAAGVSVDYKPSGTWQTVPMNPVMAWSTILTDNPMIDVNLILHSCNMALGRLAVDSKRTHSVEHSLAGLVSRFISFPSRVREAAGLPPRSVRGRLAFGAGVVAQIFIAVVAALLIAWLTRELGLGPDSAKP